MAIDKNISSVGKIIHEGVIVAFPNETGHIIKQFPDIDCIIDDGKTSIGIESTVIAIIKDGFELLRPGTISVQEIEMAISKSKSCGKETHMKSPCLLKSHYSPCKPLYIIGMSDIECNTQNTSLLSFSVTELISKYKHIEILSEKLDLNEAAVNLLSAMHRLKDSDVECIVAEPVPERGIGIAIMDRLRKAAYRH